jgi:hypothetical protein
MSERNIQEIIFVGGLTRVPKGINNFFKNLSRVNNLVEELFQLKHLHILLQLKHLSIKESK